MLNHPRKYSLLDRCLIHLDKSVQTLWGKPTAHRPLPTAQTAAPNLSTLQRRQSISLMRVNYAGEVSAQALYHAQALTARSAKIRLSMQESAHEENDHLAWCKTRLEQLEGRTSYLDPLWYVGSFSIGCVAGLLGDSWSLGFVAETERQVVNHLDQHLQTLAVTDPQSRAILTQMRADEAYHRTVAITAGAAELPPFIKMGMRLLSKVMTKTAYWI